MGTDAVVRAFRVFEVRVRPDKKDVVLTGARQHEWETTRLQAECMAAYSHPGSVAQHLQDDSCDCGIYTYHDPLAAVQTYGSWPQLPLHRNRSKVTVIAQCVNWGYIVEGTKGYRSQYVEIESLDMVAPKLDEPCGDCQLLPVVSTVTRQNKSLLWTCDYTIDHSGQSTVTKLVGLLTAKYNLPIRLLTEQEMRSTYGG